MPSKPGILNALTEKQLKRLRRYLGGGPASQCWIWRGPLNKVTGYGRFAAAAVNGVRVSGAAHRLAYELLVHDPAFVANRERYVICHSCDNRLCVNPNHLRIGSHADNVQDRVDRGRSANGEDNGRAKFTEPGVRLVKHCLGLGWQPADLARICGVDARAIRLIQEGKNWPNT